MPSPVCIVGGTGDLGYGLALRLAAAGVPVVIGSRAADRAQAAAARIREATPGADVGGAENPEAARDAAIVILAVPFASQASTVKSLAEILAPGQLVVDTTVPLAAEVGGRPTRMLGVPQGSAAEQARELVPDGVGVVSGFHSVSAALLADLDHALDEDVLVCGDKRADRETLAELVARIDGLRPVHVGPLELSRHTEHLTPLMIAVNRRHKVRAGIHLTGLTGP